MRGFEIYPPDKIIDKAIEVNQVKTNNDAKNNAADSGCTVMIPTYNRPAYLRRILNYYDRFGEKFRIIVGDSSLDENKKLNEKIILSFLNLNILYLNDYPTTIDGVHKIDDALNYVNTKYCVFCADDDFITPKGIKQSVDFLEKNQDFTVAHGYYISFWLETEKRGKQQFRWVPIYPYKSITFPDAESRLTFHLSNYYPTFYAVHRTDFLKMLYKKTARFTDDYRFSELLPSMLTLIYGKMKKLDVFYSARERISNSAGATSDRLKDFIKADTYPEKYAKFRDCLLMHLTKKSQVDVKEAKNVIDNAMYAYMKRRLNKSYTAVLIYRISKLLDYLRLPDWIDEGIRSLYRKLFPQKQINALSINPDSKYYDDFNKIRLHVLSYSKK